MKWVNTVKWAKWVKWVKWVKREIREFGEIKVNMVALVNIEWWCYETEICMVSIGEGGDQIVTKPPYALYHITCGSTPFWPIAVAGFFQASTA